MCVCFYVEPNQRLLNRSMLLSGVSCHCLVRVAGVVVKFVTDCAVVKQAGKRGVVSGAEVR